MQNVLLIVMHTYPNIHIENLNSALDTFQPIHILIFLMYKGYQLYYLITFQATMKLGRKPFYN